MVGNVAHAATGVPEILNHQGRLFDSGGNLLGGAGTDFCFKFAIYDDATVGAPDTKLWPSGNPSTMTASVKNGVFNVGIGDTANGGDTLDYNFQDNDTVYLNVEVATKVGASCTTGGDEVFENLTPRQRILASGYALNANTVGGFTPAQSASGTQVPVLTADNLVLGGSDPQINATGANVLLIQGGAGTGDIQFFSSANNLTSAGALTIAGNITAANLSLGGTLTTAGAFTTSGANALTITTTGATNVTVPTTGTLSTLTGAENLTNKTLGSGLIIAVNAVSDADDTRSLGTSANRWKDLFLGPASLHIVSTAGQTGTARDWTLDIFTTAGVADQGRGNFRILEGINRIAEFTPSGALAIGTSTSAATRLTVWGSGTGATTLVNVVDNASTTLFTILENGNVGIGTTSPSLGPLVLNSGAYVSAGGAWTNASSKALKENFQGINNNEILAQIQGLTIEKWNYKKESAHTHTGPYAEDFQAAFGVGDGQSISTVDGLGVSLAGIKALAIKTAALAVDPVTKSVIVDEMVKPSIDDKYDLGSPTRRWRNIYVGPKSLNLVSTNTETNPGRNWSFEIKTVGGSTGNLLIQEGSNDPATFTPLGNLGLGLSTGIDARLTLAESTVASGGILFGTDTNLYRSAANTLKTDGALTIAGNIAAGNLTLGGNLVTAGAFTTSGANALTLTTTGTTNVTLPTTGTLATLAGVETLTNKTLTNPTMNAFKITDITNCDAIGTDSSGNIICSNVAARLNDISDTTANVLTQTESIILDGVPPGLTPRFVTNKMWIVGSLYVRANGNDTERNSFFVRRGTACDGLLVNGDISLLTQGGNGASFTVSFSMIDSPETTGFTQYILCGKTDTANSPNTVTAIYMTATEVRPAGADLAELYATNDASIGFGDVVAIDPLLRLGVKKATTPYDTGMLGVVSTNPGQLLSDNEIATGTVAAVALVGRAPVRVSRKNGPIAIGDYLTSSDEPGVAMKATEAGTVLGIALTAFDADAGTVIAFIKPTYYQGPKTLLGQAVETIGTMVANGIAAFQEITARKITVTRADIEEAFIKTAEIVKLKVMDIFQMRDRATGEMYCGYMENGIWKQEKCADINKNTVETNKSTVGTITTTTLEATPESTPTLESASVPGPTSTPQEASAQTVEPTETAATPPVTTHETSTTTNP